MSKNKVIYVKEETYQKLFLLKIKEEKNTRQRITFNDLIKKMIKKMEE
ncbi:MAG: hypothetical protein ACTSO2_13730 [Promethearchaeota archaeon]